MKLYFGWSRVAGLVCFQIGTTCIHFAVKKRSWIWGRQTEPYDLCLEYFGCGPLFLIVWLPKETT